MIPPLDALRLLRLVPALPADRQQVPDAVYYGRYLGFDKAPHLWGGWAEYVYVDLEMLPGTKINSCPTTCRSGSARWRSR